MDPLVFLAILVVVAILALPIVAIVTANSRAAQLRSQMATLMGRIGYLEERLENLAQRIAAPAQPPRAGVQAAPAPAVVSQREVEVAPTPVMPQVASAGPEAVTAADTIGDQAPTPVAIAPAHFASPPRLASFEAATPDDSRTLESRVGSQWFNRIGILAMLIGVAWFLKMAFDNHWIVRWAACSSDCSQAQR
jgi:uncharacterized membrane protein